MSHARLPLRPAALDARTRGLLRVGAASYLGRLGAVLVLVVTVPLARRSLDAEIFGVWMMLSALLAFLAFADLGIGNALLNRITELGAQARRDARAAAIKAGYLCTGVIAALLAAAWVSWAVAGGDPRHLVGTVSEVHRDEIAAGIGAFVLLMALNVPASLIQKVQLGAQQGQWVGVAQFAASLMTLAAIPAALYLDGGLPVLVVASLGPQVLANLVSTGWWLHRHDLAAAVWAAPADGPAVTALLRNGGLFLGLQLAAAFAFQSDAIVITQVLGAAAYGDFAVVQRLFLLISAALGAGMTGLWPAFGDALARGDRAWARKALLRGLAIAGAVATLGSLVLAFALDWLALSWFHLAAPPVLALTLALVAWTVLEAMGNVGAACLNGANLVRVQLLLALAMAGLAFGGKWWATELYGPPGAVAATVLAYLIVSVPGQIFIFRRLFAEHKAKP